MEDLRAFPKVSKVWIKNYKNLSGDFPLSEVNVLVGPNGSGKSAWYEVLSLLANLAMGVRREAPLDYLFRGRGGRLGFRAVVKDGDEDAEIALGVHWEDGTSYSLKFRLGERGEVLVEDEEFVYKTQKHFETKRMFYSGMFYEYEYRFVKDRRFENWAMDEPYPLALYRNFIPGKESERLRDLRERLSYWRFYKFNIRPLGRDWNELSIDREGGVLYQDGSNLAQVLFDLKQEQEDLWEAIRNRLEEETKAELSVKLDRQKGIVWVELKFPKFSLPLGYWPDGWKAYLLMSTALLTARSLVFIEEPEAYMHPRLLHQVAQDAELAAERGAQVVFTTHSISLVNQFSPKYVKLIKDGRVYPVRPGRWMEEVGLAIGDAFALGLLEREIEEDAGGTSGNRDR